VFNPQAAAPNKVRSTPPPPPSTPEQEPPAFEDCGRWVRFHQCVAVQGRGARLVVSAMLRNPIAWLRCTATLVGSGAALSVWQLPQIARAHITSSHHAATGWLMEPNTTVVSGGYACAHITSSHRCVRRLRGCSWSTTSRAAGRPRQRRRPTRRRPPHRSLVLGMPRGLQTTAADVAGSMAVPVPDSHAFFGGKAVCARLCLAVDCRAVFVAMVLSWI
jgi:hypothetical protein